MNLYDAGRQWCSVYGMHLPFREKNVNNSLCWYELLWPRRLDTKYISAWLHGLSGSTTSKGIRFVVVAHKGVMHHYIVVPAHYRENVLRLFTSLLPGIEVTECKPPIRSPKVAYQVGVSSKVEFLNIERPDIANHAILSALQTVGRQESITLEWRLFDRMSPRTNQLTIDMFSPGAMGLAVIRAFFYPPKEMSKSNTLKQLSAAWKAALFIAIDAETTTRCRQLYGNIIGALKVVDAPNAIITSTKLSIEKYTSGYPLSKRKSVVITPPELAGMLGWPTGERSVNGVLRIMSRRLPIPSAAPDEGKIFGASVIKNSKKLLRQSISDGLMHTHIIGPTGVGKSTLLLNLITQDIQEDRGVVVIDPKGDLVHEVLFRIPDSRRDDVVVLDPTDLDFPVGLNPLSRYEQPATLIADDILSIFRKLYGAYFGPRSEDILHAGLLTLTSVANMSLCALPVLFTNSIFRKSIVNTLQDPLGLGSFWEWFETISTPQRNVALAPVMNKLRAFLLRPNIRQIIGQGTPRFDITDVLTKRRILLVNLAKGGLGSEASQLFGSLVVSQIWQAVQSRASVPFDKRDPVFLYIDEVQDYLHLPTDIADVLAQSRGYGVGMVLAHQHLGQLPKELKSAVLANARSRICFQLAHEDAMAILGKNAQISPEDFEELRRFHIYARLMHEGRPSPWMSARTLPAGQISSDPDVVRNRSRSLYGVAAADVEVQLQQDMIAVRPHVIGVRR